MKHSLLSRIPDAFVRHATHILVAASLSLPSLSAQASLAGPRLFPAGCRVAGAQSTTYDAPNLTYEFRLKDATGTDVVRYRVPLRSLVNDGVLRVEEAISGSVPMVDGGLLFRVDAPSAASIGCVMTPAELASHPGHSVTLLSHSIVASTQAVRVKLRDSFTHNGSTTQSEKTYILRLRGRSLEISMKSNRVVRSDAARNYAGATFGSGEFGESETATALHIPYMDGVPVFRSSPRGTYVSRMVDWYMSNASHVRGDSAVPGCPPAAPAGPVTQGASFSGEAEPYYYGNDAGELNAPIDETLYITVSTRIAHTFPVVDRAPSEYRRLAAERVVSQISPNKTYAASKVWVDRMISLGVDDMVHIKWDWTKYPTNNLNVPDRFDPAPAPPFGLVWGTAAEWRSYVDSVADGNWSLALYLASEIMDPGINYGVGNNGFVTIPNSGLPPIQFPPANPAYDATVVVRDANSAPKLGWDTSGNLGTGDGAPTHVIAVNERQQFIEDVVARVHDPLDGFVTGGIHIDANTQIPHGRHIDEVKDSGRANTIAHALAARSEYFRAAKDGMEGPLMGENSHWRWDQFESYDAGLVDGTSRKIPIGWNTSEDAALENQDYFVIPDFELTEVAPKAGAFYGMGWEDHFDLDLHGTYPISAQNHGQFIDEWNTTLLSFGHAPFFSTNGGVNSSYWEWASLVKCLYLTQGLSSRMRYSQIDTIRYEDMAGVERNLNGALANGLDLRRPRLVLRFTNGLEFKANHSSTDWVTSVRGTTWTIPPNGFVGDSPDGSIAFSAINPSSGNRVDYARVLDQYEMIDLRGDLSQSFNGFPIALPPAPAGITAPEVFVRDDRNNQAIYAKGGTALTSSLGAAPPIAHVSLEIDDTNVMTLGRSRIGVRAVATNTSGGQRDVTGLVTWSSTDPSIFTVNRQGGLRALQEGSANVVCSLSEGGTTFQASHVIEVDFTVQPTDIVSTVRPGIVISEFQTDSRATASLVVFDYATGALLGEFPAHTDPSGKFHTVALQGFTPQVTLTLNAKVTDTLGQSVIGTSFSVTPQ